jgi:hypothetical protein
LRETLGGQAAVGWAARAFALVSGVMLIRRGRPVGWLAAVIGLAGVVLGVVLESSAR